MENGTDGHADFRPNSIILVSKIGIMLFNERFDLIVSFLATNLRFLRYLWY